MGGHTMREGLTVGRSLPAAAIVRLAWAAVNGAHSSTRTDQPRGPATTDPHCLHLAALSHGLRQCSMAARADGQHLASPGGSATWVAV